MEPTNKHIDLAYLKELSNGSNEFMAQMISIFMVQTPEAISNIDAYLKKNDWKSIKAVIHKMKPSFSFMGIKELQNTIPLVEKYCETETHLNEVPKLIMQIKTVCELALQELETEKKQFL